ncbi:hypothetical protein CXB51_030589 [Gossypium anomalum]|uniref:LOB domain-containing protein n=1 Tax=Gossypium anomalum TaxID=47600 RepID=A0A8J5YA18_9ROSI|nr:hypothetical protein CXB51_030589 [Gossypium anomalum]
MTLKSGTTSACAACKYQRRKCIPECLLAPYFPADQTKVFQNAHKLFGVSNIVKILKSLDPSQHAEAMRSIKYQANVRDKFPVYGCLGVIRQLYYQIQLLEEEFHSVLSQLEMYRQYHHEVPSQLELGMAPPTNGLHFLTAVPDMPVSMQHSYSNSNNIGYCSSYVDSKDHNNNNNNSNSNSNNNNNNNNSLWIQHPFLATNNSSSSNSNENNPLMAIQSQLLVSNTQPLVIQHEVVQDYDELHPFFDTIDDRQSFIHSKEPYDSSCEDSAKETTQAIELVPNNELKNAAACFSLTSVH